MKKFPIFSSQLVHSQRGFTLIELLASTVVIISVGVILISIIVSSLRGTNKTNNISITRQNGTHAISQIAKMLRFARSVDAIGTAPASECITNTPLPAVQPTPQAGHNLATSITYTTIDGEVRTIACLPLDTGNINSPMTIASMSGTLPPVVTEIHGSLLDTDAVHIPAGMCKISCNQSTSSDAMIVSITFSLRTVKSTSTLFSEFTASSNPLEFNTSIILRNLGR